MPTPERVIAGFVNDVAQFGSILCMTKRGHQLVEPDTWYVYRTAKSASPGREQFVYSETRQDDFHFGDLTCRTVDGTQSAYFVANYVDEGTSRIKQVPLVGGPWAALTLATSPGQLAHDLVADDTSLYWADSGGLRKMPIRGGPVTTLLAGVPVREVGLTATQVVYSVGTSIRSVPKAGGPQTNLVTSVVTTLFCSGTGVYWGAPGGAVRSLSPVAPGGTITTHVPVSTVIRYAKSVSFGGTRALWIRCINPSDGCFVNTDRGEGIHRANLFQPYVSHHPSGLYPLRVLGDHTRLFWSAGFENGVGIWRYTY